MKCWKKIRNCFQIKHYNDKVQELLKNGESWSNMWLKFGQQKYNYDENFLKVSNYALNNEIISKEVNND